MLQPDSAADRLREKMYLESLPAKNRSAYRAVGMTGRCAILIVCYFGSNHSRNCQSSRGSVIRHDEMGDHDTPTQGKRTVREGIGQLFVCG